MRRHFIRLIAGVSLLLAVTVKADEPAEQVSQNTPNAQIVLVDEAASPEVRIVVAKGGVATPRVAAEELQRLVKAATEASWKIVDSPQEEGFNVVVGPHPSMEAAGLKLDALQPEGYRLLVSGNSLFIVGRDTEGNPWDLHWLRSCQTGTLFGVVEFARQFFHARWLVPGDVGEVISQTKRLAIPASLDITGTPGFKLRRVMLDNSMPEVARYMRFNRMGWSYVSCYWHNWFQTISPEVYSKEHPEWFALVKGVRATHLRNKSYDGQLCTSNPEVAQKMADIAVEYAKASSKPTMFSLSENDGGNHCECANCRALDHELWEPGLPSLSDRFANFANEVRTRIGDRAPGLTLGYYAYHQGELPPVKTRLLPGIAVSDVYNGYDVHYHVPKQRERRMAAIKGWRESAEAVQMVTYFHGVSWWSLPMFSPEALAELIRTAGEYPTSSGVSVGLTYEAFGVMGNEFFLAAELLWNPKGDIAEILDDYYKTGYGAAADDIRTYFDQIRVSFAAAARNLPPSPDETRPDTWVLPTFDPIRAEADRRIASALATAEASGDPNLKARVTLIADGWRWTKIQCDVLRSIKAYQAEPTREKAGEVLVHLSQREAFLAKHDKPGDFTISAKDVRATDQGRAFPVRRMEYEMAVAGETKSASVPLHAGISPATPRLEMIENREGKAPGEATYVQVGTTKEGLEFVFDIKDANADRLLANVTERDGAVWKDDVVEVFLQPEKRSDVCYHLLVNPLGTLSDIRHKGASADLQWDSKATASATRRDDGWRVELFVPFRSLEATPRPGDIWRVNFVRSRRSAGSEDSAWSPTFGLFLRPERFGQLIFTASPRGK